MIVPSPGQGVPGRDAAGESGGEHTEHTFGDATGHWPEPITTGDDGSAEFKCPAGSLSVWLPV